MRILPTLLLFFVFASASAQWELMTPLKNTSEFEAIEMVNDLVGYAADRASVPFCDCILGFTLASSRNPEFDFQREFMTVNPSVLSETIMNKIYPTLLYPANSGQIQTIEEQASTISLGTGSISVLDFAGPAIDTLNGRKTCSLEKEVLVREAEARVRQRVN